VALWDQGGIPLILLSHLLGELAPRLGGFTLDKSTCVTMINVYNVYNLSPFYYNDEINTALIIALNNALTMPGRHIVVGDFNLYYLR
jgi:hypothetical protein